MGCGIIATTNLCTVIRLLQWCGDLCVGTHVVTWKTNGTCLTLPQPVHEDVIKRRQEQVRARLEERQREMRSTIERRRKEKARKTYVHVCMPLVVLLVGFPTLCCACDELRTVHPTTVHPIGLSKSSAKDPRHQ